jgi:hypothetical protein
MDLLSFVSLLISISRVSVVLSKTQQSFVPLRLFLSETAAMTSMQRDDRYAPLVKKKKKKKKKKQNQLVEQTTKTDSERKKTTNKDTHVVRADSGKRTIQLKTSATYTGEISDDEEEDEETNDEGEEDMGELECVESNSEADTATETESESDSEGETKHATKQVRRRDTRLASVPKAPQTHHAQRANHNAHEEEEDEEARYHMALAFRIITKNDALWTKLQFQVLKGESVNHVEVLFKRKCRLYNCPYLLLDKRFTNAQTFDMHMNPNHKHLVCYSALEVPGRSFVQCGIDRVFDKVAGVYEFYNTGATYEQSLTAESFLQSQLGAPYDSRFKYWNYTFGICCGAIGPSAKNIMEIPTNPPYANKILPYSWTCSSLACAALIRCSILCSPSMRPAIVTPGMLYDFASTLPFPPLNYTRTDGIDME